MSSSRVKGLTFRHHAFYIQDRRTATPQSTLFYIFSQQIYTYIYIYINNILNFLSPSLFIPPQNFVYFLMLRFLVHKIFTFYINGVLNCKCPAPGSKGYTLTCKNPSNNRHISPRILITCYGLKLVISFTLRPYLSYDLDSQLSDQADLCVKPSSVWTGERKTKFPAPTQYQMAVRQFTDRVTHTSQYG